MKQNFDQEGTVFKQTKNAGQFLKQGEIDVLGVDHTGTVHALEVAFYAIRPARAGLGSACGPEYGPCFGPQAEPRMESGGCGLSCNGNTTETCNRVLKKMLRTMMVLRAYHPPETGLNIYFTSPKVNPVVQEPLEKTFQELRLEYPGVGWNLITNDGFTNSILRPTLEKSEAVADTSELFVRSAKLLGLSGMRLSESASSTSSVAHSNTSSPRTMQRTLNAEYKELQPLVQGLMETLLEEQPTLLSNDDIHNMMSSEYCKREMGLRIGNHALLRNVEDGILLKGRSRYYTNSYAGRYYVCSQWGKAYHLDNARSLLKFVPALAQRKQGHPGIPALEGHAQTFSAYIGDST